MSRPLYEIAQDVLEDWKNPYFGAQPYINAMLSLNHINDKYGFDDARSIVRYFLSNASSWRGATARKVKAELRRMLS